MKVWHTVVDDTVRAWAERQLDDRWWQDDTRNPAIMQARAAVGLYPELARVPPPAADMSTALRVMRQLPPILHAAQLDNYPPRSMKPLIDAALSLSDRFVNPAVLPNNRGCRALTCRTAIACFTGQSLDGPIENFRARVEGGGTFKYEHTPWHPAGAAKRQICGLGTSIDGWPVMSGAQPEELRRGGPPPAIGRSGYQYSHEALTALVEFAWMCELNGRSVKHLGTSALLRADDWLRNKAESDPYGDDEPRTRLMAGLFGRGYAGPVLPGAWSKCFSFSSALPASEPAPPADPCAELRAERDKLAGELGQAKEQLVLADERTYMERRIVDQARLLLGAIPPADPGGKP